MTRLPILVLLLLLTGCADQLTAWDMCRNHGGVYSYTAEGVAVLAICNDNSTVMRWKQP